MEQEETEVTEKNLGYLYFLLFESKQDSATILIKPL